MNISKVTNSLVHIGVSHRNAHADIEIRNDQLSSIKIKTPEDDMFFSRVEHAKDVSVILNEAINATIEDGDIKFMTGLRIGAARWFQREDFMEFVNKYANATEGPRLATWHTGGEANDFSDIFLTYDDGEGDSADMVPEDIWEEICQICEFNHVNYALLWIVN